VLNQITNDLEIILCIDMNENAFDGKLQRLLSLLDLIEVSSQFSTANPVASYISRSKQIDTI